ncbi:unnamed protein product [Eruca vesicaria subsp. sativa]|uniref:Uncharacterized protein n=1 Tax=Eruca vesicaria subsp. sativa TaxID=29727 RepID=A0ABC8KQ60_ERUVS|nr:unnamed protein product [Eruca vesicaria subsp. sativa]
MELSRFLCPQEPNVANFLQVLWTQMQPFVFVPRLKLISEAFFLFEHSPSCPPYTQCLWSSIG